LGLRAQLREVLVAEIRGAVTETARALVEDEVLSLVGEPWSRKGDSPLRRNGATTSTIYLDGQPCLLPRSRVRDRNRGTEVPLRTLQSLASRDALDADVKRLLVRGVSTRNYDEALGQLSEGLGLQKSAVSSAFVRASRKDLDAINGRSLREWTFVAVFIDGVGFAEHTCVVALGITTNGEKKILGVREGATENAELVGDLLAALEERELTLTRQALFVIDGSKALRKAIEKSFGERALVQRCVVHKLRNVLSYLPPKWEGEVRRRLNAAWGMSDYREAKDALSKAHSWLAGISEAAAASLAEGFEETLTVHRLGVRGTLRRTLATTNPIESAFDIVRANARRVKRWNGSEMALRWTGSGLVRAEHQFRRVKGHAAIPALIAALENVSLTESKDVA
jgi:transposase-like protein